MKYLIIGLDDRQADEFGELIAEGIHRNGALEIVVDANFGSPDRFDIHYVYEIGMLWPR